MSANVAPDAQSRKLKNSYETIPVDLSTVPRETAELVPAWQMVSQPFALADAMKRGFERDPLPLKPGDFADSRPILVLDFDGVISPLPTTERDSSERGRLLFQAGNRNYVYIVAAYGMGSHYWVSLDLIEAGEALQ